MSKETTTNMEKYYIETYSENIPFSRSRTERGKRKKKKKKKPEFRTAG